MFQTKISVYWYPIEKDSLAAECDRKMNQDHLIVTQYTPDSIERARLDFFLAHSAGEVLREIFVEAQLVRRLDACLRLQRSVGLRGEFVLP